jgi:hypothetical protein
MAEEWWAAQHRGQPLQRDTSWGMDEGQRAGSLCGRDSTAKGCCQLQRESALDASLCALEQPRATRHKISSATGRGSRTCAAMAAHQSLTGTDASSGEVMGPLLCAYPAHDGHPALTVAEALCGPRSARREARCQPMFTNEAAATAEGGCNLLSERGADLVTTLIPGVASEPALLSSSASPQSYVQQRRTLNNTASTAGKCTLGRDQVHDNGKRSAIVHMTNNKLCCL